MTNNTNDSNVSQQIWLPVLGYEGIYEVSSFGEVRSLNRTDSIGRYRIGGKLSPSTSGDYDSVQLCKDGAPKQFKVHKLVAQAFMGACPVGLVVNHKDCNKKNNHAANLEYVTSADNSQHAVDAERYGSLSHDEVRRIRSTYPHKTIADLAKEYNAAKGTITNILNCATYSTVTDEDGNLPTPANIVHGTRPEVARQIREQFHNRQCSIFEFAKKFGVSEDTVYRIMNGKHKKTGTSKLRKLVV